MLGWNIINFGKRSGSNDLSLKTVTAKSYFISSVRVYWEHLKAARWGTGNEGSVLGRRFPPCRRWVLNSRFLALKIVLECKRGAADIYVDVFNLRLKRSRQPRPPFIWLASRYRKCRGNETVYDLDLRRLWNNATKFVCCLCERKLRLTVSD